VNPVDSLPVIAEISLGLVGLTVIVTVLRRPDGALAGAALVQSLHLLLYASATILLALLPYLLTAMNASTAATWRLCSLIMLLCSVIGFRANPFPRIWGLGRPLSTARSVLVAIWVLAFCNAILQLVNAAALLGPPQFWPFLLGLLWYVVFCLAQFGGLLFTKPTE